MALTQSERIAISKKLVQIPLQNAQADKVVDTLEIEKQSALAEDNSNKTLLNSDSTLIGLYQTEIARYDGNGRTTLSESDISNGASKLIRNFFFPNDPQISLPSLPDGIWKQLPPFHGSKSIGRTYTEGFNATTAEQALIGAVQAAVAVVEGFSDVTRSTGQECTAVANPSPPPPTNDTISNDAAMQAAGTDLINAVQAWRNHANGTLASIPTALQDPDPTRSAENTAAVNDINPLLPPLDTWLALPDYDTAHGASDCASFNSINVSSLNKTKFRADAIADLNNQIAPRNTFIATRIGQINGHLGSVSQDLSSGEILSESGFYGRRARFISMRLDSMGGSLVKLRGIQNGQDAQQALKAANQNAEAAYSEVLVATLLRAPAQGNNTIHVLDSSGFSVSDSVYIVATNQQEISANVVLIDGNRIVLDTPIPKKYRNTDLARLYKEL